MSQRRNQKKFKKYLETNENGNVTYQNLCNAAKFSEREVQSDKCLPQETKTFSNKQPKFTLQGTRKIRTNEAQSQQIEGNSMSRVKINEIETNKQTKNNSNKNPE